MRKRRSSGCCASKRRAARPTGFVAGTGSASLNEEVFANLAVARTVIERRRLDHNLVRPRSAHGGMTPDAVRFDPAAGQLRRPNRSADRPLPAATETRYQPQGFSQ